MTRLFSFRLRPRCHLAGFGETGPAVTPASTGYRPTGHRLGYRLPPTAYQLVHQRSLDLLRARALAACFRPRQHEFVAIPHEPRVAGDRP